MQSFLLLMKMQNSKKGPSQNTYSSCEEGPGTREDQKTKETFAHSGKTYIFACSCCLFESFQESDLHEHLNTHSDTAPLKCPYCTYAALTKPCMSEDLPNNMHIACEESNGAEDEQEAKEILAPNEEPYIFACPRCLFESFQESDLHGHLISHADSTPSKCSYCEYMAPTQPALSEHLSSSRYIACEGGNAAEDDKEMKEIHEKPCNFACSHCPFESFQESDLHLHLNDHQDIVPFKCPYCEYIASTQPCLSQASPSKNDAPNHSANVSNGTQNKEPAVKDIYEVIDSPEGKKLYKCIYCKYTTCKKSSINMHAHVHSGLKPLKCMHCDFSTARKKDIKRHMVIHTGERPFQCPQCPYKASQLDHIREHMHTHTGKKRHKCPYCEYRSTKKANLNAHLPVHTGERPFPCSVCSFKAARKKDLNRHMLIHTGERPYKCPHCPYRANQSSHLQEHMLKHFGEKPFACSYCDHKTSRASYLKSHMQIHIGDKPYKCPFCDYQATKLGTLHRHLCAHTNDMLITLDHRPP